MNKTLSLLFVPLFLCAAASRAQLHQSPGETSAQSSARSPDLFTAARSPDIFSVGLGIGQDYGGFGANFTVYPQKNIGIFGGAGFTFAGFGYNAGIKLRQLSRSGSTIRPFLEAMYGYNAAIHVSGNSQYNKLFYGPTFGIGVDAGPGNLKKGYFSLALLIPIRNSDVDNYIADLRNNDGVSFENSLFPITISVGYKLVVD